MSTANGGPTAITRWNNRGGKKETRTRQARKQFQAVSAPLRKNVALRDTGKRGLILVSEGKPTWNRKRPSAPKKRVPRMRRECEGYLGESG